MGRLALRPALRAYAHTPTVETAAPWEDSTKSLAFAGSSSQYAQASAVPFDPAQAYSVSLWYKAPTASTGTAGGLFSDGTGHTWASNRCQIKLQYHSYYGVRVVAYEGEGGSSYTRTDLYFSTRVPTAPAAFTNPQIHEWNHVVFTSESTSSAAGAIKLYWNGTEVESGTGKAYGGSNYQTKPTIGANSNGANPTSYYTGDIDQAAIYQRTLSASDVAALYGTSRKPQTPYLSSGDPIHLWAMGENVTGSTMPDQVGSLDMTLYNSPTVSTDVAPAAWANRWSTAFDGTDDYLKTSSVPIDETGPITVSIWFKRTSPAAAGLETLWALSQNSPVVNPALYRFRAVVYAASGSDAIRIYCSDGAGGTDAFSTFYPGLAGNWHHLVFTCAATSSSSGLGKHYFDGVYKSANDVTVDALDSSASLDTLWVGAVRVGWAPTDFLDGSVTEMTCWDRVLSATEVSNLYNSGIPTDPMNTSGVTADAVAYYRMGDRWNAGTVPDQIGSVNLTMSSAPVPEEDVPLWTPAAITTRAWYDANDASTITQSGGTVSQWDDKSGNGYHASQSTASKQPTYNSTGMGSLPALEFDANANAADRDNLTTSANCFSSTDVISCFIVFQSTNPSDTEWSSTLVTMGSGSYRQMGVGYQVQNSRVLQYIWGYGPNHVTNTDLQNPNVLGMTRAVTGSGYTTLHNNGTATADTTLEDLTMHSSFGKIYIGTNSGFAFAAEAAISEIVIMGSLLSTANREKIEGYLAWKWDGGSAGTLVGKLPASHPYKSGAPTQ